MPRFMGVPKQIGTGITGGGVRSGVKIIGIPEAVAKLVNADKVIRLELGALVADAALNMEREAKANINSITGNLEAGTYAQKVGSYSWEVVSSSLEGDNPEKNGKQYAAFVEYGTSTTGTSYPSFAYMRRAYNDVQPLVNAELKILAARISTL